MKNPLWWMKCAVMKWRKKHVNETPLSPPREVPQDNLQNLFANNQDWARRINEEDPNFFKTLSQQQSPEYLWIGCSDSRVPANQIIGLLPGEVFVHRNVANLVVHSDLNCLSVMQYAVDVLKVKHIIVCGHYGCGGVQAALNNQRVGLADNWLRHVQDVMLDHSDKLQDKAKNWDRLCELNVIEQALNVAQTTIVQDAWERGQELSIHSWIYRLETGIIHDLKMFLTGNDDISVSYRNALDRL